jgi:hypothetical protein
MDLDFITDPELAPKPRGEARILELTAEPYPDGQRVKVHIAITPFAPVDRPSLEVVVARKNGAVVTSLSVIETMNRIVDLTAHLRQEAPTDGTYTVQADLYYDPEQIQHTLRDEFTLPVKSPPPE